MRIPPTFDSEHKNIHPFLAAMAIAVEMLHASKSQAMMESMQYLEKRRSQATNMFSYVRAWRSTVVVFMRRWIPTVNELH
ncbi:MAG: hypothetical protein CV081_08235 [Nitrospira sp. LK265]|nr:hypothetical protein [Nitrospira sp. LK265]